MLARARAGPTLILDCGKPESLRAFFHWRRTTGIASFGRDHHGLGILGCWYFIDLDFADHGVLVGALR
jgi:hypothetical protein